MKEIPSLRFSEFWEGYKMYPLGKLGKPYSGLSGKSGQDFGNGAPFITYKQVFDNSEIDLNKCDHVTILENEKQNRVKKGDVFFTISSESPEEVGFASVLLTEVENLYLNSFCFGFRISQLFLKPEYSRFLFHAPSFRRTTFKLAQGSTRYNISKNNLLKEILTIPSLPEQQKIASFLFAVDKKIQQLTRKKELLEQYKKGVMQKLFSQEIRFRDENGKDYPKWEEKVLGTIADRINTKNTTNNISHVLTNSATQGIISQKDYFDKDIANQNNLEGYYIVSKDDFVYNPRISKHAPVGPIKRNKLKKGVMSPLYSVFRFKEESLEYFEFYFETIGWHRYLNSIANFGARHDRMNITNSDFFKMPMPYPCSEERKKISNFLWNISNKIESITKQLNRTQQFKKGLLQQMFI